MIALHLLITGHVQGVGFRDWLVHNATQLNLSGWVRNKGGDMVEALLSGPPEAVEQCLEKCRKGPPAALVHNITTSQAAPPPESGFIRLPSIAADR